MKPRAFGAGKAGTEEVQGTDRGFQQEKVKWKLGVIPVYLSTKLCTNTI